MSANSSSIGHMIPCHDSISLRITSELLAAFYILFFTPLSIFVLHVGYQRWRQQRSFATTSHSDMFAYHSVVQQLIFTFGEIMVFFATYFNVSELLTLGFYLICGHYPTLILFHVLTCVERYLAVVYPVTYLGLKQSGGVRIRNISIAFVWLQSFVWIGSAGQYFPTVPFVAHFVYMAVSFIIISFCSISVLCVLIRPGPGNVSGVGQRVDPSKRKAFNTMTAILAVLWIFLVTCLVTLTVDNSNTQIHQDSCLILMAYLVSSLPFSLVLPLLFLQRSRKMLRCPC